MPRPVPAPPAEPEAPELRPDASVPDHGEAPVSPPLMPPPDEPLPDSPPPHTGPTVPAECAAFESRLSDSLCLHGSERCFTLGDVLSPALTLWLDPTTLPGDGSRYWCDRSGKGHHAQLVPDAVGAVVEEDGRAVADVGRSVQLDGGWLSLAEAGEPVLRPGNFAVVVAAATPLEASDRQNFELFESGEQSRINLGVERGGAAVGRISSLETALVPDPVVTRSKVYDASFHLYTLYRRSEVRVLDDVLQLRLNGVLEFRASSIAIPRALDLSASHAPIFGKKSGSEEANGRGRVAAIVILRGSVPEDELARLENFLCQELAVCSAPGTSPTTPLDAGL
jgi:hypothetical protein